MATVRRDSGYTAQLGKRTSTPQKTPLIWLQLFTKMGRNLCEVIRSIATRLAARVNKQNHIYFHATFKPLKSSVKKKKKK